jgi:hypothetical protein
MVRKIPMLISSSLHQLAACAMQLLHPLQKSSFGYAALPHGRKWSSPFWHLPWCWRDPS